MAVKIGPTSKLKGFHDICLLFISILIAKRFAPDEISCYHHSLPVGPIQISLVILRIDAVNISACITEERGGLKVGQRLRGRSTAIKYSCMPILLETLFLQLECH